MIEEIITAGSLLKGRDKKVVTAGSLLKKKDFPEGTILTPGASSIPSDVSVGSSDSGVPEGTTELPNRSVAPEVMETVPLPQETSYIQGFAKSFNKSLSDIFRTAGSAVRHIEKTTGVPVFSTAQTAPIKEALEATGIGGNPFDITATLIDKANEGVKDTPDNIVGDVVNGVGSIVPDIISASLMPEVKVGGWLAKYGVKGVDKFAMYLGAKEGTKATEQSQGDTPMEQILAPLEGTAHGVTTGLMFNSFGTMSGAVGKRIAGKLVKNPESLSGALTQAIGATLSNALMFGGYSGLEELAQTGKITSKNVATNIGIGLALGAKDIGKLSFAKGMQSFIAAESEQINKVYQSKATPEEMKAVSDEGLNEINKKLESIKQPEPINQVELDNNIRAAQTRLGLPAEVETPISDNTIATLNKIRAGEPVTNEMLKEASAELYGTYKGLEGVKSSSVRKFTTDQITQKTTALGNLIETLENTIRVQTENEQFLAGQDQAIVQAVVNDNLATLKAFTEEVIKNPDEVKQAVEESTLPDQAKKDLTDKINQVVSDNDPKNIQAKPVTEEIDKLNEQKKSVESGADHPAIKKKKVQIIDEKLKQADEKLDEIFIPQPETPKETTPEPAEPVKEETLTPTAPESLGERVQSAKTDFDPNNDIDKDGDLTDDGFLKVQSILKNIISNESEKTGIPNDVLLKYYGFNNKGEYFSSQKPILEVGKSINYTDLIDIIKKIAVKLNPNNAEKIINTVNKYSVDQLNAIEKGDNNFKVPNEVAQIFKALNEINENYRKSITPTAAEKPAEVSSINTKSNENVEKKGREEVLTPTEPVEPSAPPESGKEIGSPTYKLGENHLVGREITEKTPTGVPIKGKYKVVPAADVLASHDEVTFKKSEGVPTNKDGNTLNDRDYENNKSDQAIVIEYAQNFDERAISQTPIVTKDGIVISGNNRTMSRKLAAKNGTDKAYTDALKERAEMYGIDPTMIDGIKAPMLVFEPNDPLPYTTETFSMFNKTTGKEKSPISRAIEISKTASDKFKRGLEGIYGDAKNASEITSQPKKIRELIDLFVENKVLGTNELPRYFDVEKLQATKDGVAFLENVILGSALNETSIRTLGFESMGKVREQIMSSVIQLIKNGTLGENSLSTDIGNAIILLNEAKKSGLPPVDYITNQKLFSEGYFSADEIAMAVSLNESGFKSLLHEYNNSIGSIDMFTGKEVTKTERIDLILKSKLDETQQGKISNYLRLNEQGRKGNNGQDNGKSESKPKSTPSATGTPTIQSLQEDLAAKRISLKEYQEKIEEVRKGESYESSRSGKQRIPIAPLPPDGKNKKLTEIIKDFYDGLGRRLDYTKTGRRRAGGWYSPSSGAVTSKTSNGLIAASHEAGHSIRDTYNILQGAEDGHLDSELRKYWNEQFASKPPKGLDKEGKLKYRREEGFAEWFRIFVQNPDVAKQSNEIYSLYETNVPTEIKRVVEKYSNDVRQFAGRTGIDMINANVDDMNVRNRAIQFIIDFAKNEDGKRTKFFNKIKTSLDNNRYMAEKAWKRIHEIKGIEPLLGDANFLNHFKLLRDIPTKAAEFVQNGLRTAINKPVIDVVTGENVSIPWAMRPLMGRNSKEIKQSADYVHSVGIAKRTIEYQRREIKKIVERDLGSNGKIPPKKVLDQFPDLVEKYKDRIEQNTNGEHPEKRYNVDNKTLTGIGGKMFSDVEVANKTIDEFEKLKTDDPEKYDAVNEALRRYEVYADNLLQYLVKTDRLSTDGYQRIKENNLFYYALSRIKETSPGEMINVDPGKGGSITSRKEVVKKAKGGSGIIKNPYISLMEMTEKIVSEGDKNRAMLKFVNSLRSSRGMGEGEVKWLAEIGYKVNSKPQGEPIITVFNKGEKEYWRLSPEYYEAFQATDGLSTALYAITFPMRLMRKSITNFPTFQVMNRIRDIVTRQQISQGNLSFKDYKNRKEAVETLKALGAAQFGHNPVDKVDYYRMQSSMMHELSRDRKTIFAFHPSNVLRKISSLYDATLGSTEIQTRAEEYNSVYRKMKEKGLSDYDAQLEAARASREILDFKEIGNAMKFINAFFPFTNARLKGFEAYVKAIKRDPVKTGIRFAMFAMIPQVVNSLIINSSDEDTKKRYLQLPDWRRDLFYNIPIPGTDWWITWPKPFESGLVASSVGRSLDYYLLDDKKAFGNKYWWWLLENMSPINPALITMQSPLWFSQLAANYDQFRGAPIVPMYEEEKAVELRKGTKTASRLGQLIQGITGDNVDARKIDFAIKNQFGYFGDLVLRSSNIASGDVKSYKFDLSLSRLLRKDSPSSSKDVEWVYDFATKYGFVQKPEIKNLTKKLQEYRDMPKSEEKRKLQMEIMDNASEIRSNYEKLVDDKYEEFIEQLKSKSSSPSTRTRRRPSRSR